MILVIIKRGTKEREDAKLVKKIFIKNAHPTIFKDSSRYYKPKDNPIRSGLSASSSKCENAAGRIEKRNSTFLNADEVNSLDDLIIKRTKEL